MSKHIYRHGLSPSCDECGATCGNYQYAPGKWRCPACIWIERNDLLVACDKMSDAIDLWQCEQEDDSAPHVARMRDALQLGIAAIAKAKP